MLLGSNRSQLLRPSMDSMYALFLWHQNIGYLRSLLLFIHSMKESSEEEKEKQENAAVKIQAAFRGHLVREEVKKMKPGNAQEKETEEKE